MYNRAVIRFLATLIQILIITGYHKRFKIWYGFRNFKSSFVNFYAISSETCCFVAIPVNVRTCNKVFFLSDWSIQISGAPAQIGKATMRMSVRTCVRTYGLSHDNHIVISSMGYQIFLAIRLLMRALDAPELRFKMKERIKLHLEENL